ncbi:hypothetical protein EDD15DRAFT_952755 [Pisolithus albus]|nr:hypothetical protein EDD15DRAFT_952755 [Pisolithus albus]
METLTLLCWIHGDKVKSVFTVKISREAGVGDLKDTLKRDNPHTFKAVDAKSLELYPLFVQSGTTRAAALENWEPEGNEPLDVDQRLDQAFPDRRGGKWVVVIRHDNLILTSVHCWIRGDPLGKTFQVQTPREANVDDLRKAVKVERSAVLGGVGAGDLDLYRLLVPSGVDYADELGKWRLRGEKPLQSMDKLSKVLSPTEEGLWIVVVNYPTARTQFQVYFKGQIVPVSGEAHRTVKSFLSSLLRDEQHEDIFKDVSVRQIKVYRLNPPVLSTEEENLLEHLVFMKLSETVEVSFGEIAVTPDHVCMALLLAEDMSKMAIGRLRNEYSDMFHA